MVQNKIELHERLRTLRAEEHLTQKQVADYLDVDVSTYAHYEKGDRTPDAKKLRKLAELYGLNDELLGASLPIIINVRYEKADLDYLEGELNACEWRKGDYKFNREMYDRLKAAVKPVLHTRDEALTLPDIDIRHLPNGTEVMTAHLDPRGERLIKRYLEESDKFFDLI